jgi:cytochrome c-type biogenesis protein CcmE
MKPKHQRLILIIAGLVCLGGAVALVLNNFKDNLVFFYSPSDLTTKEVPANKIIRIGGLVEEGSVNKIDALNTEFYITDLQISLKVRYTGTLPPMFHEGQGMVAKGKLDDDNVFIADSLLTKHDEKYMPPEVAEALKKSGQWKEEQ